MVGQLVDVAERHARVLQHVVKVEGVDRVGRGVDVRARVGELGLDDKGGRVPCLGGRRVVGAGVAALGLDVADVAVLRFCVSLYELLSRGEEGEGGRRR